MNLPNVNPQALLNNFRGFVQNFQQQNPNTSAQQTVQNMLNNGQMSQEQFNQYRAMANRLMGTSY